MSSFCFFFHCFVFLALFHVFAMAHRQCRYLVIGTTEEKNRNGSKITDKENTSKNKEKQAKLHGEHTMSREASNFF